MRDIDMRRALHAHLLDVHPPATGTLIIDEFDLCGVARVDVAAINGALSGFEIKSERDTLRRLPGQAEMYSRVLDFATLVVADNHMSAALNLIPEWWAVTRATGSSEQVTLDVVRVGSVNVNVDATALVWLLWRDEALAELETRDMATGVRSKPRRILCERLAADVSLDELRAAVRDRIRARKAWRVAR
jgi:hypothetical protein